MLSPVRLYFDDVQRIVEIVRETHPNLKIKTDEYELDSIDELQELKREYVSTLHLSSDDFEFYLSLSPNGASIYSHKVDAASRGVVTAVEEYIRAISPSSLIFTHLTGFASAVFMLLVSILFLAQWAIYNPWLVLLLLVPVIWWLAARYNQDCHYSTIYLKTRTELPTFWRRNADAVIVNVVVAVVSAVVGGIVGALINQSMQ